MPARTLSRPSAKDPACQGGTPQITKLHSVADNLVLITQDCVCPSYNGFTALIKLFNRMHTAPRGWDGFFAVS